MIVLKFRSCKEAYLILKKLQQFTLRPIFKEQLNNKYEAILKQYEKELTTIEMNFLVWVTINTRMYNY